MKSRLKNLFRKKTSGDSLISISISRSTIIGNLNYYRDLTKHRQVTPVLKSNAYGHGLGLVAEILKKEEIPFFVVDSYFEAKAMRNEGVKNKILVIGYSLPESIISNNLKNISFVITSLNMLEKIAKNRNKEINIHLKIDTGMNRQGITFDEMGEAIKVLQSSPQVFLEGICSHFADADSEEEAFTKSQIEKWNLAVKIFKEKFPDLKYWHIKNTAGHNHTSIEENVSRLGLGLYSIPNQALEIKTVISSIKKIKKGEAVGYSKTFYAEKDMTIATIPFGYYEGLDKRLSNKGFVKIGKNFAPIIGRISMNISTIDISNIQEVSEGTEVIVISKQKEDRNSITNIAKDCHTIPYEIMIHIPSHLKRLVID